MSTVCSDKILKIKGDRKAIALLAMELVKKGYTFIYVAPLGEIQMVIGYIDVDNLKKEFSFLNCMYSIAERE